METVAPRGTRPARGSDPAEEEEGCAYPLGRPAPARGFPDAANGAARQTEGGTRAGIIKPRAARRETRGEDIDGAGSEIFATKESPNGHAANRRCGRPRRDGSPYCARHHDLCHVRRGSAEEAREFEDLERLAQAVGGRSSRFLGAPSRHFLERVANAPRLVAASFPERFFDDEELL